MSGTIDQFITAIALLALLIARWGVADAAARSGVAARLRTLYTLTGLLLALRLLAPLLAMTPLVVALMTVAAWLPFAGVRLVEELCRRHAPRPVKLLALGGGLAFTLVALTLGVVWSAGALLGLAAYQSVMLVLMIRQLAGARRGLGTAERRTLDTFLLALPLTIPLALTDFPALFPDLPVRGGAIAVLLLVLASSRLVSDRGTPAGLIADLLVALGASGAVVLAGHVALLGLNANAAVKLAAGGWAIAALLLLVERAANSGTRGSGLTAALARTPGGGLGTILSAHPLLEAGRVLEGEDLAGYPSISLARLLEHRVISADIEDAEAGDAGRDLLQAAQATHLLRISRDPPRLLAIAAGGLAGAALDDEIEIAARLIEGRA
ncbi:hypothetical protein J2W22_002800 [Sphingomonas kyeonggiensis]|uniref:hypothetical protein n=1 Tax=Sphingomonas kyeonggiensis TaxID=1268553 RepID=UPI00278076D6|nr:hypothetical protein [Sphingomonas kyeonggiensis]MDQ0250736.1 hypothetical protein [Sphingomonas kyeonggiensis]